MIDIANYASKLMARDIVHDPNQDGPDYTLIRNFVKLNGLLRAYFRPDFTGLHNIPREGPALMVGSHGLFGFDYMLPYSEIYHSIGRVPVTLADRILYVEPLSARLLQKLGFIQGNFENGLRYLEKGHLVAVVPGGAREGLKDPKDLYKLLWHKSFGFIKLALKAQVPLVLYHGIGIDDTYRKLGKMRWTGKVLGNEKYELPLWLGWGILPKPVKFHYYFSEPFRLEGTPEDAEDPAAVERIHGEVWKKAQAMLDEDLACRKSVWFG